ncbi:hypothetical protein CEXT_723881 [Caerostris extrusa]|uniref:Uncharacterized protein n=1 Tax=Caerostris extrusa TaxID=172846 RepID=A0AAV4M5K5_CAEEX|nr:hypothetical protein CEXT_723881 [Caerostris extrusa]
MHGKPTLVATSIDFSQQTDTLQHPLKGNGQHLHEDKFSSIPFLPPEAKKCAWETDADFTSLVATAIDFSQQTDTLQHPLKGNGQHLHEGDKFSSIPFLPPEAKKCAWETDADFTSLVATAIDFSQKTDTLQHPLKGNGQHLHEGTNSAPSPSYLQRQRSVHGKPTLILHLCSIPFLPQRQRSVHETDADFTSLVATAIDFSQQTDTLQHPLKGNGQHLHEGTNSAPSPFLPPEAKNSILPTSEAKKCAWETDADFTSLVATAIDFSQQTDTLQHPLKGNGQHLHEGDKFSSILPTSRGKKCAWETDADLHLSGSNSNRFLATNRHSATSFKGTANICMRGQIQLHPSYLRGKRRNGQHLHEGDKFSSILPTSRGKKKCAWETDADFTSLVATAIDFSQKTDTLQHPLKGNGQHLHEGTNSAPSFLPPEAKKCAWETDADFTSLVATAIDFSQQTDTLQHPLKGTANICMRDKFSSIPFLPPEAKKCAWGNRR